MSTTKNPYIGHDSQLIRLNDYQMLDGLAKGLHATDIQNGELDITVAPDRGMDIPYLSYKGLNIGYITSRGMVAPQYFDDKGMGFFKSFTAGFLTTCGLTHMGAPSDVDGIHYGMHGRIASIPAEQYSAELKDNNGKLEAVLKGKLTQSQLFSENLVLTRQVNCGYNDNYFEFTDTVTNEGFSKSQLMILYHFNIGYPMLDESAEIIIPANTVETRDEIAQSGFDERFKVPKPISGFKEMCYFYKMKSDKDRKSCAILYNHNRDVGISIGFDASVLDYFTEWKMVGEGEYVVGLEPGNATPLGVKEELKRGHVKYLNAGESLTYRFRIEVFCGQDVLKQKKSEIEQYS